MAQWWPVLGFMAFLFLTMIPILVTGLMQHRADQAKAATAEADPLAAQLPAPRFFASSARNVIDLPVRSLEEAIVAGIQTHLEKEQELAAGFVAKPSFASLHRRSRRAVRPEQVERYLARELVLADAFVSAPSVESLHRRWNGHAVLN